MRRAWILVGWLLLASVPAQAQPAAPGEAPIYYAVERQTTIYSTPDSTRPYVRLGFREPVYATGEEGAWLKVHTDDGAHGYVHSSTVSNVWIRVSKHRQTVYVYRGTELVKRLPADLGNNFYTDKERRGSRENPDDWRTPEGGFFVVRKNPRSQFYKAFVLNYPTAEDAERGYNQGLITKTQRDAIVQAEQTFSMPPMHTSLGGWIEIHGNGTGVRSNWTQGCVAIRDVHMDQLWSWVEVGTPVLIEP